MKIDITQPYSTPPVAVHTNVGQSQQLHCTQSINPVFNRDSLSLGTIAPQYQNYSAPITQNGKQSWEGRPFGSVARISMPQLLPIVLGDYSFLPEGCDPPSANLTDERREFLLSFHERILTVTSSDESIKEARDLGTSGKELSDDEQINAIIAKYAQEPLGHELYDMMMQELWDTKLFDFDEWQTLKVAARMGIQNEEVRLFLEFQDFVKKNEDRNLSVPDLYDLFMKELEKRESELAQQREITDKKKDQKQVENYTE
jgi:hypothetical protein